MTLLRQITGKEIQMELDLNSILPAFLAESYEGLDQLETTLLDLDLDDGDSESLALIFRIAHTIKGSAGMFGLDEVVSFTHVVENCFDRLRDDSSHLSQDLIGILLACGDHIRLLLKKVETKDPVDHLITTHGNELLSKLSSMNGMNGIDGAAGAGQNSGTKSIESGYAINDNWHISLQLSLDSLRNGMDPLAMLRYLETFGEIVSIATLVNAMPPISSMDPESLYLRFEISFNSPADLEKIEEAFEFYNEGSTIVILPPNSKVSDYVALTDSSNQDSHIGNALVSTGALSRSDLNDALNPLDELIEQVNLDQVPVAKPLSDTLAENRGSSQMVESSSVRVDSAKLDELINLVGELVMSSAGIALNGASSKDDRLIESISTLTDLVEEVRNSSLSLRMVPIGATFTRFKRLVHDMSKELGKEIELVITGADTELDKTVVEKISDPLMHLVRNSIDHGIENAQMRIDCGKPAVGVLTLNAYHESGSIVIEVNDDGAGLNRDRILSKSIENGLVEEGQTLDDEEIYNLIFKPGFSTAKNVTNISGRGVGMDVVRRNINDLRGAIELSSEPGVGTHFKVRLPLTLAIIDGFLVSISSDTFVIPLAMIVECIELETINDTYDHAKNYINLRGEVLPLVDLRELLTIPGDMAKRRNIVVVQNGHNKAGIVVDQLLGEFQAVIKPLGPIFNHVRAVSGCTVLGTGKVSLILDIPGLIQKAISKQSHDTSIRPMKSA
jgi:two-component system chemotaxis sensor kinase CheA